LGRKVTAPLDTIALEEREIASTFTKGSRQHSAATEVTSTLNTVKTLLPFVLLAFIALSP
jgi:hypothetical protein